MLQDYLTNIVVADSPDCPLCNQERHTIAHLVACPLMPTALVPEDLWHRPVLAATLIEEWQTRIEAEEA